MLAETSHYTFHSITIVYLLIIIAILKEEGSRWPAKPCVQSDNGPIRKNRSSMFHSQALANCRISVWITAKKHSSLVCSDSTR
jgi:hypothetical protein